MYNEEKNYDTFVILMVNLNDEASEKYTLNYGKQFKNFSSDHRDQISFFLIFL